MSYSTTGQVVRHIPGRNFFEVAALGRTIITVSDLEGFMDEPLTKNAIDTLSGKLRRVVIKLYNGEDLDRFLTGKLPFDAYTDRV